MQTTPEFQQELSQWLGTQQQRSLAPEQEATCYTLAFKLYEKKSYRKAAHLFTTLVLTNPFASHYWQGLASSKQMARDYEAALHAWGLMALLETHSPLPHFYAAECLLALHEKEEAQKALEAARTLAQDSVLEEKIHTLAQYVYN